MAEAGLLVKDTVVATVMSNIGFVRAMREAGLGVRQTKVGDRYVLEAMRVSGYTLGGEQSGHVIMSEHATTGDGILTALHVLERMAATGQVAGRARVRGDPLPAGAGQRRRTSTSRAPTTTPCSPPPSPRRRPRWGTPAACCCARPAPRTWCG